MTRDALRPTRVVAAVLTILGGSVHLQQWWRVFRHIDIGPLFLLNALSSVVVAVLLVNVRGPLPVLAGVALAAGSLVALFASRTTGLLGFEAVGYDTAEIEAIVLEALTLVALAADLVVGRNPQGATGEP